MFISPFFFFLRINILFLSNNKSRRKREKPICLLKPNLFILFYFSLSYHCFCLIYSKIPTKKKKQTKPHCFPTLCPNKLSHVNCNWQMIRLVSDASIIPCSNSLYIFYMFFFFIQDINQV